MQLVTDVVYSSKLIVIVGCSLPEHIPVSALKTVLKSRDGSFWPGITVDKSGYVYFVDGTTIQMINDRAVLTTFICSRGRMSTQPLSCDFRMDITQVSACYTYITISEQVKAPFGHHSLLNKSVVHSTLEAAKAIIVSYQGLLYIAETDDRKIHRIQQVSTNGEISVVAGSPSDCDCKIDPNCDCFSGSKDEADALSCMYILSCMYYTMNNKPGDGSYACDAHLKAPFSLAVAPNGTLYIADLGNIWIRSISTNRPQQTAAGMYEIISPVDQELYLFSHNGTHLHTKHLITGDFLYNFTYSADWHLKAVVSRDGSTFHVQCDSKGIPLWLVAPRGKGCTGLPSATATSSRESLLKAMASPSSLTMAIPVS
ncbi:hypothetical protein QTP70_016915 [Hemibagrus guttatus]|uniref:Uncharacterized protein n=1 Tax=Hemibagrus guttatus TaxID=175788 RepID=A0AAE0QXE2_9TELE|nr:hypothetical protein QTP70_016915 [Hemibagrus guttatus]